jgi:DNA-directed RNA polymerase subunit L
MVDSEDKPVISYYDSTYDRLKVARFNGISWSNSTVDTSTGTWTSITPDSSGEPIVSYFNTSTGSVEVAWYNGSSWDLEVVDVGNASDGPTSIHLDKDNYPAVSYYSSSNTLKIARYNGSTWDIDTVDATIDAGSYNSLAVGIDNNPIMAYFDATNKDLKIAWNNPSIVSMNCLDYATKNWALSYPRHKLLENSQGGVLTSILTDEMIIPIYDANGGNSYILSLPYNFELTVIDTAPTLGATDVVISPEFVERGKLDLHLDGNQQNQTTVLGVANTVDCDISASIENAIASIAIDGNDKTFGNTLQPTIKYNNTITTNVNQINHCSVTNCDVIKSTGKNFNDCENIVVQGLVERQAEIGSGDYDA